jgi:hypothetical protein
MTCLTRCRRRRWYLRHGSRGDREGEVEAVEAVQGRGQRGMRLGWMLYRT